MKRTFILWACVPVCATLYQLFIKLAAAHMVEMDFGIAWIDQAIANPWMWAAFLCELAAFIAWMNILATHDLSKAFPLSAASYVLILCTSWFVFHEAILPLQLLGGALILTGIWMIATAKAAIDKTL